MEIYGYPKVGRFGLTHSLLAWARCYLWCQKRNISMLSPNWSHIRLGPYLRREKDKRQYQRLFQFDNYVTGFKRWWLVFTASKIAISEFRGQCLGSATILVVFENCDDINFEKYFHEILDYHQEIRSGLIAMTKKSYFPEISEEKHIAIHIRRGDFSTAIDGPSIMSTTNVRLPLKWYAEMLLKIRDCAGYPIKAIVYSDGVDEELSEVLSIENVERSKAISAITDLLAISEASLLLASGSGFSLWGSYLGQVPRICYPGQRIYRVLRSTSDLDLEIEIGEKDDFPEANKKLIYKLFQCRS